MSEEQQHNQLEDIQNPPSVINETPKRRDDGMGYIDDAATEYDGETVADDGSSIEEDSGDEGGGFPLEESDFIQASLLQEQEEEDEEDLDWGVENEDWELADGDFTKQYNRVRQSYGAAQGTVSAPLPARNVHQPRKLKAAPATAGTVGKSLVSPSATLGGVAANPKSVAETRNQKDKADRATHEQVLDSRTRLVLSALVNRGFFALIDGCVSTGKEANVYLAHSGDKTPDEPYPYPAAVAIKIYRTSILNFRARQNYIVGEHRFRGGYASAKNPRKMVRLWAEKELRNLRRLVQGGVRAPIVIEQRENVLVMEFLGSNGAASPRLKDAEVSNSKLSRLYGELLVSMRRMYHVCHLVHADLSEYNVLYHNSHVYIIDVSQSVEHDHPSAFDFLRSDIRNVEDFFHKRSGGEVRTLGVRRAWSFIVDESVGLTPDEEAGDDGEARLLDILRSRLEEPEPLAAEVDDAVFMKSYIPRSLGEVYDPERDIDIMKAGGSEKLIYAGITGLSIHDEAKVEEVQDAVEEEIVEVQAVKEAVEVPVVEPSEVPGPAEMTEEKVEDVPVVEVPAEELKDKESSKSVRWADEQAEDEEGEDEEDEEEAEFDPKPRGFRHEDKDSKKERKKALKEENREKRKHKMPKNEKARLIKKSSGRG